MVLAPVDNVPNRVAREAQIVASRNAATCAAGDHIFNLGPVSGRCHAVNGKLHWTKAT
jgi:hypothetical protein